MFRLISPVAKTPALFLEGQFIVLSKKKKQLERVTEKIRGNLARSIGKHY